MSAESYVDLLERLFAVYADRHELAVIEQVTNQCRTELAGQTPPGAHLEMLERLAQQHLDDLPTSRSSGHARTGALPLGVDDDRGMQSRGVLPEDAPDPRVEQNRRLRDMPSPVMGLIVQPSMEDTNSIGISDGSDGAGYTEFAVSITYTLWRNPADRSDPVNLPVIDEEKRAAIEMVTPWPRPARLIEQVQRLRYPQLWEAVRTTWSRDLTVDTSLAQRLEDHANYILNNQYRDSRSGTRSSSSTSALHVRCRKN